MLVDRSMLISISIVYGNIAFASKRVSPVVQSTNCICWQPSMMARTHTIFTVLVCLLAVNVSGFQQPKPSDLATVTSLCVIPDHKKSYPETSSFNLQECHTLDYYISQQERYFSSNTKFLFVKGTHNHATEFVFENASSVNFSTLYEAKDVVISCSPNDSVGFIFNNVTSVTVQNLNFTGCGQVFSFTSISNVATLAFINGESLTIDNVNISNSRSQGMMIVGLHKSVFISSSLFFNATDESNDTSNHAGNSLTLLPPIRGQHTFGEINIENSAFIKNSNRMKCAVNGTKCKCKRFAAGLAIIVHYAHVNITLNRVIFDGNLGCRGGNMALIFYTKFTGHVQISKCVFRNGNATFGGGILISFVEGVSERPSDFMCNSTFSRQSPREVMNITNSTFQSNAATLMGGAMFINQKESIALCRPAKVVIGGDSRFTGNSLAYRGNGGAAIHYVTYISTEYKQQVLPQFQLVIRDTMFFHNTFNQFSKYRGSGSGVILLRTSHYTEIKNISIYGNSFSGIVIVNSNLIVSGYVHIHNNSGSSGGGMLFCSNGVMFLTPNTTLNISNNHVEHAGGGICVEEQCLQSKPICFFQRSYEASVTPNETHLIKVIVQDNTAKYAGDQIYGGSIDFCYILYPPSHDSNNPPEETSMQLFKEFFVVDLNSKNSTSITSPQRHVCLCNVSTMVRDCSMRSSLNLYPGESFNITTAIVGQLNGTVPGTVYANVVGEYGRVKKGGKVQKINTGNCETLTYTINSNRPSIVLELGIQFAGDESFADHLSMYIPLEVLINYNNQSCPVGFETLSKGICNCMKSIRTYFNCDIQTKSVTLKEKKEAWIGLDGDTLLLSHGWALDYCNRVTIYSNDSSIINQNCQCQFNRTGVLCGSCSEGFSVTLGSSECRDNCSYYHVFLIPVFALAGLLLVALIAILNLTVAEGTTNGLIFYANILHISETVFFRGKSIKVLTPTLRAFIAWLNLDLGVTTCLYRGMDDYAKAWLQFVFPLYIWTITGLIICLSRRFNFAFQLVKRNGVKVLATLVLISYSKMLRASVNAFHPKYVHHIYSYSNKVKLCWILDCNLPFLEGKHIVLFLAGVGICVVLLPFTLTLLCIDQLNKLSNKRCFTWVWKLKPFFDSYTGPYSNEGRFWTGLLCTVRILLILIRNLNDSKVTHLNVVLANAVVIFFLMTPWILRSKIYKKRWLNILECSLLLNIGVLSLATLYDGSNYIWLTHISVGIAFATFIAVIIYHLLVFPNFIHQTFQNLKVKLKLKFLHFWPRTRAESVDIHSDSDRENLLGRLPRVVYFNQDREPLLAESDD